MVTLYVTSLEKGSGKTAVCAGLGKHLLNDGKKVGFFKPIIGDSLPEEGADSDATFMKNLLGLKESAESICPVISDGGNLPTKVKEAFTKVARGKDVVVVEGIYEETQVSYGIVEALDAGVIIVAAYSPELPGEKLVADCEYFGKHLLGVVFNKVPGSRVERIRSEIPASPGKAGANIIGVLPEDRALLTLTVGELADTIQGEILNNAEKSGELVENIMLGALSVDTGLAYYGRKANKVAVLRSDRSDMQMAALETSTRAMVISGDTELIPSVRYRAEDKNIPVILSKNDVAAIVNNIEDALAKARFHQEDKVPKLVEIMEQNFDFSAVYKGLGLTK